MLPASEEITLLSSLPKPAAEQAEQKNVSQENVETAVNVETETEETAEQEKKEAAKDPLRTTSAGGATTTVTGLHHVLKEETEAGAVKETAIAKKAVALNVEEEVISNVIVGAVPSAVGDQNLMKSPEAVEVEEMRKEVEGDLTVTAAALKTATVAETAETGEADLIHLTTATVEQEKMIEEAAHLRNEAETKEMTEDTIVIVELVGLHPRNRIRHQDLILTLVRLASDHPPGLISKKKADVKDAHPATATMKCLHLEADHAAKAEDANAVAPRNPTTKDTTLRKRTSSSQNSLPEKNNLQEFSHRITKIAPAIERFPRMPTAH